MTNFDWVLETISKKHDRSRFDCTEPDLNKYTRRGDKFNFSNQAGVHFDFLTVNQTPQPR
jgi:hypothetical protein